MKIYNRLKLKKFFTKIILKILKNDWEMIEYRQWQEMEAAK